MSKCCINYKWINNTMYYSCNCPERIRKFGNCGYIYLFFCTAWGELLWVLWKIQSTNILWLYLISQKEDTLQKSLLKVFPVFLCLEWWHPYYSAQWELSRGGGWIHFIQASCGWLSLMAWRKGPLRSLRSLEGRPQTQKLMTLVIKVKAKHLLQL